MASLEVILQHNAFSFNGSHFLQVHRVAMGTCCAPYYANLYLGEWEHQLSADDAWSLYMNHVTEWYCYIDDVLLLWDGLDDLLHEFMTRINTNDFNLKFTMSHSASEITFLDVSVHKQPNGSLSSELYRKITAGNSLLHASSFHPKTLLASITNSQYIRARRNCSVEVIFQKAADVSRSRLLESGYSKSSQEGISKNT